MHMPPDPIDFSFISGADVPVWVLKAGETIFNEGDIATELYIIHSGRVGIYLGNRLLDTLETNEIFGEMALIDSAPRSATAIATTDVTLTPVSKKQFLALISRTPSFALDVMAVLAQRLRAANRAM
jgi:CRP/FNR family transcriptional regulator, cyclic AMP receptor protein